MPLDPEKLKRLMAIKDKPKTRGGRRKSGPDVNVRTYETWFALQHLMMNNETKELFKCENPDCQDPRHKGILVVDVNGTKMCRFCFLDGWLLENPEQLVVSE